MWIGEVVQRRRGPSVASDAQAVDIRRTRGFCLWLEGQHGVSVLAYGAGNVFQRLPFVEADFRDAPGGDFLQQELGFDEGERANVACDVEEVVVPRGIIWICYIVNHFSVDHFSSFLLSLPNTQYKYISTCISLR